MTKTYDLEDYWRCMECAAITFPEDEGQHIAWHEHVRAANHELVEGLKRHSAMFETAVSALHTIEARIDALEEYVRFLNDERPIEDVETGDRL